jgi:hypothetical protein
VLFVSAVRLLIISDYSPSTAAAIVSSGGYIDTLLGTVIPLIPLILPYLALLLLILNRVILGLLALLATALVSPTTTAAERLTGTHWTGFDPTVLGVIIFVLAGLVVALALLVTLAGAGFGTTVKIIGVAVSVALIPTFAQLYPLPATDSFYTRLLRQPWLPAETFTMSTGQRFTGYALADDGTWIEILNEASRTITYYQGSKIVNRQLCELNPVQATRPLLTLGPAPTGATPPACETTRADGTGPP